MTTNEQQFQPGDPVRNINPLSLHHGKHGSFQRVHDKWTFPTGPACDVLVEGESGPYGHPSVIMSVGDLELASDDVAQERAEIAAGIRRLMVRDDVVPLAKMFLGLAEKVM